MGIALQIEEERKNNIFSDLKGGGDDDSQPAWVHHMANIEEGKLAKDAMQRWLACARRVPACS
jgi:hypothetical protein